MKPFSEGEFIKKCMKDVAGVLFPEKTSLVEKLNLSRRTVARRVDDITGDLNDSLRKAVSRPTFIAWSIATDETTDRSDKAQLLICIRGIDTDFTELKFCCGPPGLLEMSMWPAVLKMLPTPAINRCCCDDDDDDDDDDDEWY